MATYDKVIENINKKNGTFSITKDTDFRKCFVEKKYCVFIHN